MRHSGKGRVEADSMGAVSVPSDALYGASTQRAVENFPISDFRMPIEFIRALALIKLSCLVVNREEKRISARKSKAIEKALKEVLDGKWDDQFVVDVFQTGSGTSTNMNLNEVVARRARFFMRADLDDRSSIHPNDDVNLSQSSNDVIPSALHLSALLLAENELLPSLESLRAELERKSQEFAQVVKSGRTHLQDATPITLGQEFSGYEAQLQEAMDFIGLAAERLRFLAIGGTAVGTGINAPVGFGDSVCKHLTGLAGVKVKETGNHFRSQSTIDDVVFVSSALKSLAVGLIKIANDLRWMSSGPNEGLAEITIPEVQPGSSIMPGKVNPVILESVLQSCVYVLGADSAITVAGQSGNFELNVMLPLVAHNLLTSLKILANSARNLSDRCIKGIEANEEVLASVQSNSALATALNPLIGYDAAARIAKIAQQSGKTILAVALEETSISESELKRVLDPLSMTMPRQELSSTRARKSKKRVKRTGLSFKVGDKVEILNYKTALSWGDRKPQKFGFVVAVDGGYIYVKPRWWKEGEHFEFYASEIKLVS